jgi:hypothetical protein
VARLVSMDLLTRNGPEFADPARGAYDPDVFDLYGEELEVIDLRPPELKDFILANREALLAEAGLLTDSGGPPVSARAVWRPARPP